MSRALRINVRFGWQSQADTAPTEMDAMNRREVDLNLKIAKEAGLKFNQGCTGHSVHQRA